MKKPSNVHVIKVGGSVLVPDDINVDFLGSFIELLHTVHTQQGDRFFVIIGGGQTNRWYLERFSRFLESDEQKDWIGINVIGLNAECVRMAFGPLAHEKVVNKPNELPWFKKSPVTICGAEQPGHSSNYDAVLFAERAGVDRIINLSNQPFIYSENPKKNPQAHPWATVTWDDYLAIIPKEWTPKLSTPFDPIASRRAKNLGMHVWFGAGNDLKALKSLLMGKKARSGTILGAKKTTRK